MCKSQIVPAPAIPRWIVERRDLAMQIDDVILECTVFIGTPGPSGFYPEGTGFFVKITDEQLVFSYIISCRHVVNPTLSRKDLTPNPDPTWIRINSKSGPPLLIETKRREWTRHPDKNVDLCAYCFDSRKWDHDERLAIATLMLDGEKTIVLTEEKEKRWGLSLGDEIFMAGVFVGRVGEEKNLPIVRVGNIAAMPSEPMWGASHNKPAFLIETRSLGGTSGSPVFLHTQPEQRGVKKPFPTDSGGGLITPYYLIGIMQGYHTGNYTSDFLDGDEIDAKEKIMPKDADFNAGIGVALPVSQIMELIYSPALKEARMATIDERKSATGYKDASARPKRDQKPTDENPNAQEDFMRLQSVAARKQPQGE